MDIQRTVLWIVFTVSVLFLWDNWQRSQGQPSMFGRPEATHAADTLSEAATGSNTLGAGQTSDAGVPISADHAQSSAQPIADAVQPRAQTVHIETDVLRVDIDTAGAVLSRVELLNQTVSQDWTANGVLGAITGKVQDKAQNVVLLEVSATRTYLAQSGAIGAPRDTVGYPTHRTQWSVLEGPRALPQDADTLTVVFEAESGGVRMQKRYTFHRGRYDVDVAHTLTNLTEAPISPSLYFQIMRDGNKPEGQSSLYYVFTGPAVYSEEKKFQKIAFEDIEDRDAEFVKKSTTGWIAMIQHYFVSAWVPPKDSVREYYTLNPSANLFVVGTQFPLGVIEPGASVSRSTQFYAGPQDQDKLEAMAPGLDLVVDYGWLTFIAKPLFWLLKLLHGILGNWGWAIVVATCLIKAAFYPLSAASYKSMARMKEVTPRLMKIREQYADDKQKMNLAMMELYKNEKINPVGGCLPILIQIPVFIAYYWVILGSVEMRHAPWILWVNDLATPDPWLILPLIMVATMWIQFKLNPTPPDPMQAKVMAAMPFIFGAMFFFFPAGLVLYWLVNNVLSIAQQWYVTRQIAAKKPVG